MINNLKFIILICFITISCSFNNTGGFWSKEENLKNEKSNFKPLFKKDELALNEFNKSFEFSLNPRDLKVNKESINDLELTRIGLMRTRANVEGVVISIAKRDGVRLDEKPWSMVNLHLWDGAHVAEVVAFGSSITNQITDLSPLDRIKIVSAELGWRSSLPQLRIDQRSTRLTKID